MKTAFQTSLVVFLFSVAGFSLSVFGDSATTQPSPGVMAIAGLSIIGAAISFPILCYTASQNPSD